MKKSFLRTAVLLCVAVLLSVCTVRAAGNEKGSIEVCLPDLGTSRDQVKITVYQVGEANTPDQQKFVLTKELSELSINFHSLDTAAKVKDACKTLEKEVIRRQIAGEEKATDKEGKAVFDDLLPGIYLITQTSGERTYGVFDPILAFLPVANEDGILEYAATAVVKAEKPRPIVTPDPTNTPTPSVSPTPTDSPTPTPSVSPKPTDTPTPTSSPKPSVSPRPSQTPTVTRKPTTISRVTSTSRTSLISTSDDDTKKKTSTAKTGDESNGLFWLGCMGAAAGGILLILIRRRKIRQE